MKYFKNTELATIYHVSEKSVRNWIESTQNGKLDLELHKENDRYYVANTTKNLDIIQGMVEERKKFTNSRAHKTVKPKIEFYKLYNDKQIIDILTNIDTHHEVPLQYSYFNGGATYWQQYIQKLAEETTPNLLNSTMDLLDINRSYIDAITKGRKVNIFDLGIGEGTPAKNLLTHLLEQGRLNRYMGLDFSRDMLKIAAENVQKWFGSKVNLEPYVIDLNYDRFADPLRRDLFHGDGSAYPLNIILLLGGTLTNNKDPDLALSMINASMGKDDYLIYAKRLDTESSRRYFDFNIGRDGLLTPRHMLVPDLLNIDPSLYEVEQFFNDEKKARIIQLRLKVDLTIEVATQNISKKISLRKGETVLIWRAWHQSSMDVIDQFDRNGFELLQASMSEDRQYLLTISKVKMH